MPILQSRVYNFHKNATFLQKYLVISKKSSIFAPDLRIELNSD